MHSADLITEAERVGLSLHIDGDDLVIRGPRLAVNLMAQQLAENKASVMRTLQAEHEELLAERVAIMVVDGGLAIEDAERLAKELVMQ